METFNAYFTVVGAVAIVMGIYMLFTKKLLGRNTGSAGQEKILKFLPIEVGTYVSEGALMILMGQPKIFPFVENTAVIWALIVVSLAIVAANVILGKKFFPDAKPPEPRNRGPRLK